MKPSEMPARVLAEAMTRGETQDLVETAREVVEAWAARTKAAHMTPGLNKAAVWSDALDRVERSIADLGRALEGEE